MGCLILLILAYIFRGAILGLVAGLIGALIALFSFLFSLGFWGIIAILLICAIVAVTK